MPLAIFGFLGLSLVDALDILLVALIIFLVFRWIRGSAALNIFLAVIVIYAMVVVVDALGMKLMSALLGTFVDVGVVALIVIFQPEIRQFLYRIGSETKISASSKRLLGKILRRPVVQMDSMQSSRLSTHTKQGCRSSVQALTTPHPETSSAPKPFSSTMENDGSGSTYA